MSRVIDDHLQRICRYHTARPPRSAVAAAVATVGLLLVACSGGSSSPKVASLGSTTTTMAADRSPAGGNGLAHLVDYSACMRAHGLHDFPDPTPNPGGQGGSLSVQGGPGSDLNPNLPQFQAAAQACKNLLPEAARTPAQVATQVAAETRLAACIRSHGVPDWPDPDSQGTFDLNGIDPDSPQIRSAVTTCQTATHFNGPMGVRAITPRNS
jgi:hypothetical protein